MIMPNNMKFELSHLAQNDLEEIWLYTVENWSINQGNRYYKLIIEEINTICSNPEIGKPIPTIKKRHRILPVKSHLIRFQMTQFGLTECYIKEWILTPILMNNAIYYKTKIHPHPSISLR